MVGLDSHAQGWRRDPQRCFASVSGREKASFVLTPGEEEGKRDVVSVSRLSPLACPGLPPPGVAAVCQRPLSEPEHLDSVSRLRCLLGSRHTARYKYGGGGSGVFTFTKNNCIETSESALKTIPVRIYRPRLYAQLS